MALCSLLVCDSLNRAGQTFCRRRADTGKTRDRCEHGGQKHGDELLLAGQIGDLECLLDGIDLAVDDATLDLQGLVILGRNP